MTMASCFDATSRALDLYESFLEHRGLLQPKRFFFLASGMVVPRAVKLGVPFRLLDLALAAARFL